MSFLQQLCPNPTPRAEFDYFLGVNWHSACYILIDLYIVEHGGFCMSDQPTSEDPREQGVKPEFPEQPQEPAGLEEEMDPKPDYGEDTYRGSGKL